MRKYRILALLLTTAMLLTLSTWAALPNFEYGRYATGAIATEETSPIILEQENLIFNLDGCPIQPGIIDDKPLDNSPYVTAEYTFRNPTEDPVSLSMLLPFDASPYKQTEKDDLTKYSIRVDGEQVESTLRHSYYDPYQEVFNPREFLPRLIDGWAADPFFDPEMTITKYTYQVLAGDSQEGQYDRIQVSCVLDPEQTMVYLGYVYDAESAENTVVLDTYYSHGHYSEEGKLFFLYVIGEPLKEEPVWSSHKNRDPNQKIDLPIQLVSTEQVPLKELFCLHRNPDGEVSESDWYNAVLYKVRNTEAVPGTLCDLDLDGCLMRWYEYELNFEPGQSLVNSVTTTLFPTINLHTDPREYIYTYLLSQDRVWNSSGQVNVTVNTTSCILNASPEEFEKTDTGYRLTLEKMPDGELEFTLCASEYPKSTTPTVEDHYSKMIGPALLFLAKAVAVVFALAFVWHLLKKKRNRVGG